MLAGTYTAQEARQHQTFHALMWALSYPGRTYALPAAGREAFQVIGETLLDLETSYYTPHAHLHAVFAQFGARSRAPDQAAYHFYPHLDAALLEDLANASVGSYADPDTAATLVIGCSLDDGTLLHLRGPGIPVPATLTVAGIPAACWTLREQACCYPLGWDIVLVAHDQVVGVPRTTHVVVG
jgi:alpha-D-ribose 1-methylphosphonate 5-triphosphate synthase subunit PhnH